MRQKSETLNETWTTEKGAKIDFSATVETYDYNWQIVFGLSINGKKVDTSIGSDIRNNIFSFRMNGQSAGIVVSQSINDRINNMIQNAKLDLQPREAEWNHNEESLLKMDRE